MNEVFPWTSDGGCPEPPLRDLNVTEVVDDIGNTTTLECEEWYYVPSEIPRLLKTVGFTNIGISGAHLGACSRDHRLTTDDFEKLVTARKAR